MGKYTFAILTAGLLVLVLPTQALPSEEASEDILITDPVLLERMGLDADATNVYATPQVLEYLLMEPAEYAAAQEALQETDGNAEPSGAFGTDTLGFTSVGAYAFRPHRSRIEYAPRTTAYRDIACAELGASNDTPRFITELEGLPHGARLRRVHFWIYDGLLADDITMRVWRHCLPDAQSGVYTSTLLGERKTALDAGHTYIPVPSHVGVFNTDVDTRSCVYSLWVDLGESGTCDLNFLYLQKATAEWVRQVSPPPTTATFGDVSTGHPFFQHVEALAAAGITGGCGGGDFCPNSALTRGQMAVFLAKALGLHWGEISQ